MGYSSWGCKELDTTEQLTLSHLQCTCQILFYVLYIDSLKSLSQNSICCYLIVQMGKLRHGAFLY